jgi:hypothetical protein
MGVPIQVKDNLALYLINMHYMAHQTNLVVMVLFKMFLVSPIEGMFHVLYSFFGHNSKEYLELNMFAKTLVSKGQNLFKNVKTCWINTLSPLEHVMLE